MAKEFPIPPLTPNNLKRLSDLEASHHVCMDFDELLEWSEECHLLAAGKAERGQLGYALTANDRRECVAHALRKLSETTGLPESWDTPSLNHLRDKLNAIEKAVNLDLPSVVEAVIVTEQFHEAVLVVFQSLLWWGTKHSSDPFVDLLAEKSVQRATNRCRETALSLRQFRETCEQPEIRDAIKGLASFAYAIDRATSARLVVDEIVYRHHQVQSGKVDGGVPKRDWVSFDSGRILCPPQRFQRKEPPPAAIGETLTHPYRLEPFIHMLRENDVLPPPKQEVN